jgi:hypothetical protein
LYAKACGIKAKSFLDERRSLLAALRTGDELAALAAATYRLPAGLPAEEALRRTLEKQMLTIAGGSAAPPVLAALLRKKEAADFSSALAAMAAGERVCPPHIELGRLAAVRFSAYPNLAHMVKGGPYQSLLHPADSAPRDYPRLQRALDGLYWQSLFAALQATPASQRRAITEIVSQELALQNAACALRLRVYYGMSASQIHPYLIALCPPGSRRSLDAAARESLAFAPDHRPEWERWRFSALLNPEAAGTHWRLDPRYFQNAALARVYALARKNFHRHPFTLDFAACFIYLKQTELQLIAAAAGGLALGISARDALAMTAFSGVKDSL